MMKIETVVIVGTGPAGLTAAYELLKLNNMYRVILIEQESCVGGISKTLSYKGNRMDLGGHRFFSKSKMINDLWLELLSEQGTPVSEELEPFQKEEYPGNADPNQDDQVMLIRRRISRIYYLNHFFDYPVTLSWRTIKNLGFMRTMECGLGYLSSILFKREENSLEDFYINRFGKPLYELFFKDYTTKLWGVSPDELEADWGAQRVKKLSLLKAVFEPIMKKRSGQHIEGETSLIEEFYYPKFGPGQLWEKMAAEIIKMGGEILFNTKSRQVLTQNEKVKALVIEDADGNEKILEMDYLISSMPIKEIVEQMGSTVPNEVQKISQALPYRDFITVGVLLKKLDIKNGTEISTYSELIPDCWIYIQDRDVKMGRVQIFNNWSPYMVEKPKDTVWISLEYFATEGDELWRMTQEAFIDFALNELEKTGIASRKNVIDTTVHKVKKAYPAYYGSYHEFVKVRNYLDKFENLFCIGRNGQHRYNNMDHSMLTGIYASQAIQGKCDKSCLWEINTEKDYHETKENK